jgi:hypothetical protein
MFLQVGGGDKEHAVFYLPLVGAPFLIVLFSAKGSYWERQGKIFAGSLVAFFLSMVPGVFLGDFLARHYR